VLVEVAAATAADRDALHHAEARAVQARRRHAAAQHRLDTVPRRQRRTTRHDLHIAERQLDRAQDYLERTRQRAAPAVERHAHAVADQRHAHDQLRNCDTIELLDTMVPSAGEQRLHVHALTTWQHWAQGHEVTNNAVRAALAVLAHRPGLEQQLATTLRHDLGDTPIERTPHEARHLDAAAARIAQPDLGIEL
jgi:hypothetical protein